jgi:hypothetical protein
MTKCIIIEIKTTPPQNQWQHSHPHWILDRLMYQTGAAMGQKTLNQQKATATYSTKALTFVQKIVLRHEPPDQSHAKAIAIIVIQCRIDWRIKQAWQRVKRHQISKKRRRHSIQCTYLCTKNRLATRATGSTPRQSYCNHCHSMPHRLMYHTGVTTGQKTSNQQKVTATQHTNAPTSGQKIAFRHEPLDPRHAKATAIIGIECRIDWFIIQAGQWVRRHQINKMWRQHRRQQQHLHQDKKSPFDKSRWTYANPKLLTSLASNAASIDLSYRRDNGSEGIESAKSDGNTANNITYLRTKNRLSTRAAGPTPIPSYWLHWHRMPHRLIYHTGATMGEKTSNEQKASATHQTDVPPLYKKSSCNNAISVTLIQFFIDWCIEHILKLIRMNRKTKKGRLHHRHNDLPFLHRKNEFRNKSQG